MRPYNNYDNLVIKKLLGVLKFYKSYLLLKFANENNAKPNDLSTKKDQNDRINTNCNGSWVATLPVIIAEKNIDIPIESIFKLKNPALDIKNMKKDVYLTNSTLLPMYEKHDISAPLNGKLFLEGFH